MPAARRRPEDSGWAAEDLRSAYASDGSGPFRYAPDGSGPWSYDPDGSGPWLVGPTPVRGTGRFAPRDRGSASRLRRVGSALAAGALVLTLTVGSVALVRADVGTEHPVTASTVHTPPGDAD